MCGKWKTTGCARSTAPGFNGFYPPYAWFMRQRKVEGIFDASAVCPITRLPAAFWPNFELLLTYNHHVIVCHWISLLVRHNDSCATCHGVSGGIAEYQDNRNSRSNGGVGHMQSHILMMCVKCRCCCCQFCGPQWRGSPPLSAPLVCQCFPPMAAVAPFMLPRGQGSGVNCCCCIYLL